jgi:alkylhydroperoxidase family enzyme
MATDERIFTVAAWRDAPYFTAGERAALALTETVMRLSDREDPVPDHHLERSCQPLRRSRPVRPRRHHRQHQRLEPPQRCHPAGVGPLDRLLSRQKGHS